MKETIVRFLNDERGLTAVEYAIAGALVAVAVVTAFSDLGKAVAARITQMAGYVSGTTPP
jgi:pilus assembly protein Flp/PilA